MTDPRHLKRHPLSRAFFSILDKGENNLLLQDIQAHGLRENIIMFEGMVLDGWHRYRCLLELDWDPSPHLVDFELLEDEDPVAYVLMRNDLRRHRSKIDRLISRILVYRWREKNKDVRMPSQEDLAEEVGCSQQLVSQAFQKIEKKEHEPEKQKEKAKKRRDLEAQLKGAMEFRKRLELNIDLLQDANKRMAATADKLRKENDQLKMDKAKMRAEIERLEKELEEAKGE